MRNLSEAELVVLAQAGNARATSILLENCRASLLMSMTRKFNQLPLETIEDAVQIALMKAFEKLNKYNPTFKFSSWIYRICFNTVIDITRKEKNESFNVSIDATENYNDQNADEVKSLAETVASNALNPQESLENAEKADYAISILTSDKFSESMLEIAQFFYLDEMSYKDIAETTGKPLGTVKTSLNRFREVAQKSGVYSQYQ